MNARAGRLGPAWWVASGVLAVVIVLALLADVLPVPEPNRVAAGPRFAGPSWEHPLGTDSLGRDLLSRVLHGARVSLAVGALSMILAIVVGGGAGAFAGLRRGFVDRVFSAISTIVFAFPAVLLAAAVVTFVGGGITNVSVVIAISGAAVAFRYTRSMTLAVVSEDYVAAARVLGVSDLSILVRHVVPNVLGQLNAVIALGAGAAIMAEGALSFIGLSIPPPDPTLGGLVAAGTNEPSTIIEAPHVAIFPSLAIAAIILCLNVMGDQLRRRGEDGS